MRDREHSAERTAEYRVCLGAELRRNKNGPAASRYIGGVDPGGAVGGHSVFPRRGLSRVLPQT
jgi:hypothetical protein